MLKFVALILFIILIILSCGKPTDPELINKDDGGYKIVVKLKTAGYAQDVEVKDTLAYIAQGEGGLAIISVSNRENPEIVSNTFNGIEGYLTKIALKDTFVYLSAGTYGVSVINAGNPEEPDVTATNLAMKPARDLLVMGDYLFTCISGEGIKISNIEETPFSPDIRGGITNTPGYARAAAINADSSRLFVASGEMGLSIFNISEIHSQNGFGNYPLVGWGDTPGYAQALAVIDEENVAAIACGTEGLQIVSYSDTSNIPVVGSYNTGGYAKEIFYRDGIAYVTTETRGVQIFSLADVTNPQLLGIVETEHALGITADESFIYVADKEEGLVIVKMPE